MGVEKNWRNPGFVDVARRTVVAQTANVDPRITSLDNTIERSHGQFPPSVDSVSRFFRAIALTKTCAGILTKPLIVFRVRSAVRIRRVGSVVDSKV